MKIKITRCKKESGGALKIGEVVTIKMEDGQHHAFKENGQRWTGRQPKLSFQDVIRQLNVYYEFEEVKEMFDVRDLKLGQVVEYRHSKNGRIYKSLVIQVNGRKQGVSLCGASFAKFTECYEMPTEILKVWNPKITNFNSITEKLTDDCLIYEAKSEKQQEIDKLKQEIKEFTDKAKERLKKLEDLEG